MNQNILRLSVVMLPLIMGVYLWTCSSLLSSAYASSIKYNDTYPDFIPDSDLEDCLEKIEDGTYRIMDLILFRGPERIEFGDTHTVSDFESAVSVEAPGSSYDDELIYIEVSKVSAWMENYYIQDGTKEVKSKTYDRIKNFNYVDVILHLSDQDLTSFAYVPVSDTIAPVIKNVKLLKIDSGFDDYIAEIPYECFQVTYEAEDRDQNLSYSIKGDKIYYYDFAQGCFEPADNYEAAENENPVFLCYYTEDTEFEITAMDSSFNIGEKIVSVSTDIINSNVDDTDDEEDDSEDEDSDDDDDNDDSGKDEPDPSGDSDTDLGKEPSKKEDDSQSDREQTPDEKEERTEETTEDISIGVDGGEDSIEIVELPSRRRKKSNAFSEKRNALHEISFDEIETVEEESRIGENNEILKQNKQSVQIKIEEAPKEKHYSFFHIPLTGRGIAAAAAGSAGGGGFFFFFFFWLTRKADIYVLNRYEEEDYLFSTRIRRKNKEYRITLNSRQIGKLIEHNTKDLNYCYSIHVGRTFSRLHKKHNFEVYREKHLIWAGRLEQKMVFKL